MAVIDRYINTENYLDPRNNNGGKVELAIVSLEVAAGDDDGSKYRILKNIDSLKSIARITVMCDAITGGTDYDLGFYDIESGAVIDADALASTLDLSSASRVLDGLENVIIENMGKRIYELAGESDINTRTHEVDIVLTANTVGTAAGTITVIIEYVKE